MYYIYRGNIRKHKVFCIRKSENNKLPQTSKSDNIYRALHYQSHRLKKQSMRDESSTRQKPHRYV